MRDVRKDKAITLYLRGDKATDIAKVIGISRTTLYDWYGNSEFKAEVEKRRDDIKIQVSNYITNDLALYVDKMRKIALTGTSDRESAGACQYLIDRVLGKTTTKLDVTAKDDTDRVNGDVLTTCIDDVDNKDE